MKTIRLTTAQAIIRFLKAQWVELDDDSNPFFAGMWGIFGHGNVAGIGQALEQDGEFTHYLPRNEQAMVHIAAAFAKQNRRMRAFACTTSIGPGATNMVTAAAGATINRIPVLLLPGDTFARRNVGPVLQQLEYPLGQDVSVNDCLRTVSRYWDRINRPEQILTSFPEAMRVLTDPSETGAVTISLPQDVQAEAYDFPETFFEKRVHYIPRTIPDPALLLRAVELIKKSSKPVIIAGGGVIYSGADESLAKFCESTGIPVGETQAGKGSLNWKHDKNLQGIGVTGTSAANRIAKEADLVIAIGTRLSDFTTASKTQFQNPEVRFISINVSPFDAGKHSALMLVGDAKATLERLNQMLSEKAYSVSRDYEETIQNLISEWHKECDRIFSPGNGEKVSQGEIIGILNEFMTDKDTLVCAAGSLPGDLHKLWRAENGDQYHMEYGYSCMGYEIAGGLGVRFAKEEGDVFVMVGDGSYLMMHTEIVTSLQEDKKLIIILVDNHGYGSIDGLSKSLGSRGFGNKLRRRDPKTGKLTGDFLEIDFVENVISLGAEGIRAGTREEFDSALKKARGNKKTTAIIIELEPSDVPGYESWWDVPIAEVSEMQTVQQARKEYEEKVKKERYF
ncbi:MAG: 3D-(3,5/4)-trihydroxycyclohexane-1,2-dione acylhydrolase (decyclizing) [Candidatus Marinimicrobia bacterium]|nr:3D-(3,5/4)-trihydroxycyclohexane-1,2-dione acylhydrolase (decyclizing) [Candidatus Neomarinimicrobiota bacterium]